MNIVGGLTLPDFKTYYKATVIKTEWYWCKNKQIDQWNRVKISEVDALKHSKPVFDKGRKDYTMVSSTNGAGITGNPYAKK